MRRAAEAGFLSQLQQSRAAATADPFTVSSSTSLDLAKGCTVVGGKNGSGKSRLLKSIAVAKPDESVFLDLHHLCEQALIILRSRADIDELTEEVGELPLAEPRLDDLKRVIVRDYEAVQWFALEIEPSDADLAKRFQWGGDRGLVPYFKATYRGVSYDALDMGLGEFSVHLLFWILEQYRDRKGLVLLLDEPDAFLPPIGVASLLSRLSAICLQREWRMIISTHAEEMISTAVEHEAFLLLRMASAGQSEAIHSADDPAIADTLLSRPAVDKVLFVEDESALYLARALLDRDDRNLSRSTSLVWGNGWGYLAELQDKIPKPPEPEIKFGLVPDGDQRSALKAKSKRWPFRFLPTDADPDSLFRTLKEDPARLAGALMVDEPVLQRRLDDLEGENDHDWVNRLGETFGRPLVLTVLSHLWADNHSEGSKKFAAEVRKL
jgi:energy-coupling factor transporter ATP-binding protein EcfA2